ncbi:hypothetical protein AK812_SmicGene12006 [Symbiodinium microadriaticum]|uniref:Uncharacterized protein n=1 Tax=Symbiodinium microadriaticum TaxID=2951 RepID=A0A1Q9EBW5_SYMMI|nr:hypothetical protein AK812_SmicGene12006 [Symbiodinium microadriaticum]
MHGPVPSVTLLAEFAKLLLTPTVFAYPLRPEWRAGHERHRYAAVGCNFRSRRRGEEKEPNQYRGLGGDLFSESEPSLEIRPRKAVGARRDWAQASQPAGQSSEPKAIGAAEQVAEEK